VDQAAQDGSALDPVRCDVGDRVVRPGRLEVERAVRASSVVVPGVLGQDSAQVPFTEDQHPVGYFRPDGEYEPFCVGIRARTPGWNLHGGDACIGQDRIERGGELPSPVADQETKLGGVIAEIHQEIPDLLHGPGPDVDRDKLPSDWLYQALERIEEAARNNLCEPEDHRGRTWITKLSLENKA
jgi:hypothetical protein